MKTREELKYYIQEDRKANRIYSKKQYIARLLFGAENACVVRYLNALRHQEYHLDNIQSGVWHKLCYMWWKYRTSRLGYKYNLSIMPNTVGYGLCIPHTKGGVIIFCEKMGNNCMVNTGVVVGIRHSVKEIATIGDNVRLAVGCKIIGNVTVGDNVVVAPNAVVTKDVPANTLVGGVPAKILKTKEHHE